jgi:hypothetical protein
MHKGVVEFNSVVRIRNRIGVLEDFVSVSLPAAVGASCSFIRATVVR